MDIVQERYDRFKQLCQTIDPQNEWIIKLANITLDFFLFTIKSKLNLNPKQTVDMIYDDLLLNAKLDKEKIGIVEEERVRKYISYFTDIAKIT